MEGYDRVQTRTLPHARRRFVALVLAVVITVAAWAMLEFMRHLAEHADIPVLVTVPGPPPGFAARFPGVPTNEWANWIHHVPYAEIQHARVSADDIAAMRRCLARERFFPMFPSEIEITREEITARYGMRVNRRTGEVRDRVVTLTNQGSLWRIESVHDTGGIACFNRPPTRWEKFLSYLPFTD